MEIKDLGYDFRFKNKLSSRKIYYDIYLKRFIILDDFNFYITLKNELYDIIYKSKYTCGQDIIYLEKIKKNILAIKKYNTNKNQNIIFIDLKDCKIITKIFLPNDIKDNTQMKEIILFNNNYLLINIESKYQHKYIDQTILIYSLIYDNKSNFKFEYLNTFSNTKNQKYKGIFKINNIISLIIDNKILFTKINIQKNTLEEFSNLQIDNNNCNIEISKLKNEIILIKYSTKDYPYAYFKLKIYNIKLNQIISVFKCNYSQDIFVLDDKYLIEIEKKQITLYNLRTFKKIKNDNYSSIEKCYVFKDEEGNWNFICGFSLSQIKNGKINFIRYIIGNVLAFNNFCGNILSSSNEYED